MDSNSKQQHFLITGLPSPGLQMLSELLQGDNVQCLYQPILGAINEEGIFDFDKLDAIISNNYFPYLGVSCFFMPQPDHQKYYLDKFPEAPIVIIGKDAKESFHWYQEISGFNDYHCATLIKLWEDGLRDIYEHPRNVLCVDHDDLKYITTLQSIWQFCLPGVEFNRHTAQILLDAKELSVPVGILHQIRDFKLDQVEDRLLELPQTEAGLEHSFTPGLYAREITMPGNCFVISKIHNTRHPFVVTKGRVIVFDGVSETKLIEAPYKGITEPNTRRLLYTLEETVWTTYHPTDKTTVEEVEADIIVPRKTPIGSTLNNEIACPGQ